MKEREEYTAKEKKKGKRPTIEGLTRATRKKKKKAQNKELKAKNTALPAIERRYHCLVMDPPWPKRRISSICGCLCLRLALMEGYLGNVG